MKAMLLCAFAVGALATPTVTLAGQVVSDPMYWGATASTATSSVATPDISTASRDAADPADLIAFAAQTMVDRVGALAKDRPIVVTTIVDVDDLSKSSSFGRLASQLVADRFAQRGFLVHEVDYAGTLTLRPATGETVLSRDVSRVPQAVNAQALVEGTYTVGGRAVYLSIRLIKADDGTLLSSADVVIPLNCNTELLFTSSVLSDGRTGCVRLAP
jgi:TolB-like protein